VKLGELTLIRFEPSTAKEAKGITRWGPRHYRGWIDVKIKAEDVAGRMFEGTLRVKVFKGGKTEFEQGPPSPERAKLTLRQMETLARQPAQWTQFCWYAWHRLGVWID
jgi:hypothetical protein